MKSALRRLKSFCFYGFPAPLLLPRTPTERLRATSLSERYRLHPPHVRAALLGVAIAGYPFAAAVATVQALRHMRKESVRPPLWEGLRIYLLALLRNVPPIEYVFYGFTDPARRAESGEYLYWVDTPALQRLNRLRGADNNDVQDKARFASLCQAKDLPHVPNLSVIRGGRVVSGSPLDALDQRELWVKPITGSAGRGSRGWTFDGQDTYQSGPDVLSAEQWRGHLLRSDGVVQERLRNHPALDRVSNGPAVVLRLTTVCDRSGNVSLIGAGAGLPFGRQNDISGGVACALSLTSGEIVSATGSTHQAIAQHPDTGEVLAGFQMPMWQEIVDLVLRAHSLAFRNFATLGWDVVLTPEGPLLLEANSGWNPLALQYHQGPVGRTALGTVVAEELRLTA